MLTKECPYCHRVFNPPNRLSKYCSKGCANKARIITDSMREKCRLAKLGDLNPAKNPNVGRKISQHHKESGRFQGSLNPNWIKGQWLQKGSKGTIYMRVWIPPEQRYLYPACRKGYAPRSHVIWNQAHPDNLIKAGEIIHHIDGNSLNDVPENLQKFASQSKHWQNHSRELVKTRPRNDKGQFI